jgi:hypothetical protein
MHVDMFRKNLSVPITEALYVDRNIYVSREHTGMNRTLAAEMYFLRAVATI